MFNDVQTEMNKVINQIKHFWGDNVSEIRVIESTDTPFNMFTISMRFYGQYDVIMEYERSTLGISVKKGDEYIILSKLANEPIFRGLQSYLPENLLHNLKVLDNILQTI
jgi:hypothetical protein